ncbi:hypothetical protein SERLADRAFT_435347 [Serpula lacrymans var. lacrymans S7.9]|uniref:Uncharacterized protein n=1 Tax=Serpula lacrymans var. lacrymans (strain S7.9) TaxID=578457 RepID=F8NNE0_SERL9|nr:uncharacterized protein SERLADRAFT_435347 [Serpula lacrymans var. lacrymans S7.9]EGO27570.1 hypothetical protein SERLADRAFT_435347 [Serpula lacrymans var. lacrymans S7.9]
MSPPMSPSSTPSSSSSSLPSPSELLAVLHCPLCSPPSLLSSPTTLPCGHTVCSAHVSSAQCPIPSCVSSNQQQPAPDMPSSSRVAFYPAPAHPHNVTDDYHSPNPRIDVTINKLIAFLTRAKVELKTDPNDHFVDTLGDSSDDDLVIPTTSLHRPVSPHTPPSSPESSRPRKRRRHGCQPQSQQRPRQSTFLDPPPNPVALYEKELLTELSCEICFMLFFQPVTTPCQHSFCSKCLQRSLDHSMFCPLCRKDLPGNAIFQDSPTNKVILSILLKAFPESYAERGETLRAEERDMRLDTPIFVCQLSFPGMPTLLHFFEPRYRLMLRRCLESPHPIFGMVLPPRPDGQCEFGTMLEIRSVQMLSDGRSMVETWGTHRFRILERGVLDGYMVGRVERIDDFDDDLEEWAFGTAEEDTEDTAPSEDTQDTNQHHLLSRLVSSLSQVQTPTSASPHSANAQSQLPSLYSPTRVPSTSTLLATCHTFLSQLHSGTAPWVVQRLQHTYGNPPPSSDLSAFSFYMALVLPIDEHEKAKLLPVRSARLRLCVEPQACGV